MKNLFLFLKGLMIGIGKIIPGVSGSMIAVVLGVYETAILAINHLKDDMKHSLSFLIPLGLGVLLSTILFSYVITFFLNHFYLFTMFFFLGLILGTVPAFQKEVSFSNLSDICYFFVSFCIPFCIPLFSFSISVSSSLDFSWLLYFFLGFLDAATMIIPGISGTAIYFMLGCYSLVLEIFCNPFSNIYATILFSLGLLVGVFLVSMFVEKALKRNRNHFYQVIDGLLWSSIVYLFSSVFYDIHFSNFFVLLILFFLGFFLTKCFSK